MSACRWIRNRWMIEKLDQDAVRITKVERAGTIAMSLRWICKWDMQLLEPACPLVDVCDISHNESDMVHALDCSRLSPFRQLMNGKVVAAGSQIDILFVRLPLHTHAEYRTIKVNRSSDIPYIQSNMSQPQRLH